MNIFISLLVLLNKILNSFLSPKNEYIYYQINQLLQENSLTNYENVNVKIFFNSYRTAPF